MYWYLYSKISRARKTICISYFKLETNIENLIELEEKKCFVIEQPIDESKGAFIDNNFVYQTVTIYIIHICISLF